MPSLRVIARLDIKAPNLIKGIHLEGLRVIGDPNEYARRYYKEGIDELLYMDIVASLYERNSLLDIVERTTRDVFVPITVGGGIASVEDVRQALRAGADKVAVNTAAIKNPNLVRDIAEQFGSQCMVISIEAKRTERRTWEAYTDNGREHTGLSVIDWAVRAASLGAGEILITSVDNEGTRKGFDCELISAVRRCVTIPIIASGGMGTVAHIVEAASAGADAAAIADALHHQRNSLENIRNELRATKMSVRLV
jgi:imidazole glycerol-phosphate synthase subunit HisF